MENNFIQKISELKTTGNFITKPEESTDSTGCRETGAGSGTWAYTATKIKGLGMNLSKSTFCKTIQ